MKLDGVTIYAGTGLNTGSQLLVSAALQGKYGANRYFDNFACFNILGTHTPNSIR